MFNYKGKLTIEDVQLWMDGGTVTLILKDLSSQIWEIEFVQKVTLKKYDNLPRPGSLLLNRKEVEVRSETEKEIINAVQSAEWGTGINNKEKENLKQVVEGCINFINSETYIDLAKTLR